MYAVTTDAGSDIHSARGDMRQATANDLQSLFMDGDCLAHQSDIMDRDILYSMQDVLTLAFTLLDPNFTKFKYYSELATIMHLIRDNADNLFSACCSKLGVMECHSRGLHRVARNLSVAVGGERLNWGSTLVLPRLGLVGKTTTLCLSTYSLVSL